MRIAKLAHGSSASSDRTSSVLEEMDILDTEVLFNHLVLRSLKVVAILGTIFFLGSMSRLPESGWHPNYLVQAIFLSGLYLVSVFKRHLSKPFISLFLLSGIFIMGIVGLVVYGLAGAGGVLALIGFSLLTGIIYGQKIGLIAIGFSILSYTLVGLGVEQGYILPAIPSMDHYLTSTTTWLHIGIAFLVLATTTTLCIGAIQERLFKAMKNIRAERDLAQAALDAQQDFFVVYDPATGRAIRWNKTVREFSGLSEEEIARRPIPDGWADFVDVEIAKQAIITLSEGRATSCEIPLTTPVGRIIPMEFKASLFRPEAEGSELILGVGRDISERKAAEQALKDNERKYRLLTENAPIVLWTGNRNQGLTYISPNVEQVLGYTAEEIMAQGWELWNSRIHPDDHARFTATVTAFFTTGTPVDIQYQFKNKNEDWIWLHARVSRTKNGSATSSMYGTWSDVTEQVKTAEQLRQAEKMHAIGQLAGGMAHDFNNQLSVIMGGAELLIAGVRQPQDVVVYAKEIRDCAINASELTKQLLTYARKGKIQNIPLDLHQVVGEVATLLKRSVDKRITIHQDFKSRHPVVIGDSTQLQNAILNMGLNARDAMPQGGQLTITTTDFVREPSGNGPAPAHLPAGRYLCLSVSDTGTGIDEATKQRIFDPFFTTKPEGKGTGMGLAMVLGCVKSHHGDITVESGLHQGTTLKIYFPQAQPKVRPETASTVPLAQAQHQGSILLVDDETHVCRIVADILQDSGFKVHCCEDGREAIKQYREYGPEIDLVILDIIMPHLNGQDTFKALHNLNHDIRVLIATGCERNAQVETMMTQGAKGYIQKPFSAEELVKKVDETLQVN